MSPFERAESRRDAGAPAHTWFDDAAYTEWVVGLVELRKMSEIIQVLAVTREFGPNGVRQRMRWEWLDGTPVETGWRIMNDIYHDSETRYRSDPTFHAAVTLLEQLAREHGFTPGELKQIAFYAALRCEMFARGPVYKRAEQKVDP